MRPWLTRSAASSSVCGRPSCRVPGQVVRRQARCCRRLAAPARSLGVRRSGPGKMLNVCDGLAVPDLPESRSPVRHRAGSSFDLFPCQKTTDVSVAVHRVIHSLCAGRYCCGSAGGTGALTPLTEAPVIPASSSGSKTSTAFNKAPRHHRDVSFGTRFKIPGKPCKSASQHLFYGPRGNKNLRCNFFTYRLVFPMTAADSRLAFGFG